VARTPAASNTLTETIKASHVLGDFRRDHLEAVDREQEQLKLKYAVAPLKINKIVLLCALLGLQLISLSAYATGSAVLWQLCALVLALCHSRRSGIQISFHCCGDFFLDRSP
jgi:hypothetical protein